MIRRIVLSLLLLAAPASAMDGPAPANVSACFTPGGPEHCAKRIVAAIDGAQRSVRMQAYSFTDAGIAKALVEAKKRGVAVEVILDKSQAQQRYSVALYLARAGVPVWIDAPSGIAHNKVVILDERVVITGSFNFTKAADTQNVENVVVLDSPDIARWFMAEWNARRAVSRDFATK